MRINWLLVNSTWHALYRLGTGKTINSLINELLVMEARTLLSSTKFTVGRLLLNWGLVMQPVFKFFKRNAGQTPLRLSERIIDLNRKRIAELNRGITKN